MLKALLLAAAAGALALSQQALADEALRPMSTDSGGVASSPYTVDDGHWQFESEILNNKVKRERATAAGPATVSHELILNNLVVKAGVSQNLDLELGLISVDQQQTEVNAHVVDRRTGFGDATLGAKFNIMGNDSGPVAVGLIGSLKIPTNSHNVGNKHVEGSLALPVSVNLPQDFSLSLMPQWLYLANDSDRAYHSATETPVSLGHPLTKALAAFVEVSQSTGASLEPVQELLCVGLTYTYGDDLIIDAGSYFGLTPASPTYDPFVGLSLRF